MRNLVLKWVMIVCGIPAICYVAATAAGALLPERIEVTRSIVINRPVENVYWILTDYNNEALWHPQYREAQAISAPGEKPIRWRAMYTDGVIANIEVTEERYPSHLAERISDKNLPFAGGWSVDLDRDGEMCRVTAHSTVEIRRRLDRVFVRWVGHPEADLAKILAGLKERVESSTMKPPAAT
jgi:hypothetical protein